MKKYIARWDLPEYSSDGISPDRRLTVELSQGTSTDPDSKHYRIWIGAELGEETISTLLPQVHKEVHNKVSDYLFKKILKLQNELHFQKELHTRWNQNPESFSVEPTE